MNQQTTYNLGGMHQTLAGAFKVSVVDAEGQVIWEQPEWKKNLILNTGMNNVPNYQYCDLMAYGIAGTGNRENNRSGFTATVSQNAGTVTLVPDDSFLSFTASFTPYAQILEIGDTIVYDTGAGGVDHVQVVGGISGTSCTVDTSATIPATTFQIWKTSQTGLQAEVRRAGSGISNTGYVTSPQGACGTTFNGNIIAMQRTWDFAQETTPHTYNEVGVGWNQTVGNPGATFSRLLLPQPVFVDVNQRIRLAYQLQIAINPTSSVSRWDATITGWTQTSPSGSTTMGSESIQNVLVTGPNGSGDWSYPLITYVRYDGSGRGIPTLEPYSQATECMFWMSNVSSSLNSFNSAYDRGGSGIDSGFTVAGYYGTGLGGIATTKNAYVLNSYTLNKTATFGQAWVSQNIRSMGFGYGYPSYGYWYPVQNGYQAFCFVFNKEQSKYNTQTVTLVYTWTWGRSFIA